MNTIEEIPSFIEYSLTNAHVNEYNKIKEDIKEEK